MQIVLTLAWRNLWRNRRRTIIMLSAIFLGLIAMIVLSALLRGMAQDVYDRSITALPGDIQVHQQHYLNDPTVANLLPQPSQMMVSQGMALGAKRWVNRLSASSVIMSEHEFTGVELIGIATESELPDHLDIAITEGAWPSEDSSGIVIGQKLAERLKTALGRRIVLSTQGREEVIRERGVRVVGIYDATLESVEERMVYTPLPAVQQFVGADGLVSEVGIFVDEGEDVGAIKMKLEALFDGVGIVQTWEEIDPYLSSMLGMLNGFISVWLIIVFVAMSFGLVNTFVMAVFERTREIGLMLALGLRPYQIVLQVLLETLLLLVLGSIAGTLSALLIVYWMGDGIDLSVVAQGLDSAGMSPFLTPELDINDVVMANVIVVVLGVLTSVIPAWKGSKLDPITAINMAS